MTFIAEVWRKLTNTKAIEESSGPLETQFFETIYRFIFIIGASTIETSVSYFIYSRIVKLCTTLFVCSELWYLFHGTWSMDAIVDSINITFIQFSSLYKYRQMVVHREIFNALASSMESPTFDISTKARRKIVEHWMQRNRTSLKRLLVLGTCTLVVWYGYPFMDDIDYNLMVAVYLPFEYTNSSSYSITYIMVAIVFGYISYFVMVTDILMQTYLMQLLCQFSVLKDCFSNLLDECMKDFKGIPESQLFHNERFRQKFTQRLRDLNNQHRLILNNTLALRKILSNPMLGHLASSTVLICFIGYQIVVYVSANVTKSVMGFLFLGYNMTSLFVLCHWCEEISIQSEGIGTTLYSSGWERGLARIPGARSSLLLIFTRCNKPLVLTAGGMYDLSLASYANLVKTSYSALMMLLRFRRD